MSDTQQSLSTDVIASNLGYISTAGTGSTAVDPVSAAI